MIEKNQWHDYIKFNDIPSNGVFVCQPTDAVLDAEDWPIWVVIMVDDKIIRQEKLYLGHSYVITDMVGWDKVQLIAWIQCVVNSPQQESNNIMWLGTPDKEPYWFCVALNTDLERTIALSIMAYYKVRGYAVGNGDYAEFMVIDGENRVGDLLLAEMAFSGLGSVVWRQAKVCPICHEAGESICGHMYFYKAVEAAF